MSGLILSILISLIFIFALWGISRSQSGIGGTAGATLFCLFWLTVCFTMSSALLTIQALLTFLGCIFCACFQAKSRSLLIMSLAVMCGVYLLLLSSFTQSMNYYAKLRKDYPMESVADRLAYEKPLTTQSKATIPLSQDVQNRLDAFEQRPNGRGRQKQLERLHNQVSADFVLAQGFGMTRMAGISRYRIEEVSTNFQPLPQAMEEEPSYEPDQEQEPLSRKSDIPAIKIRDEELLFLHDESAKDFLEPDRMGYVKDREHVAGFIAHRFQQPASDHNKSKEWQVVRLELVSLLKHKVPVAYLSKNLPRMEELKNAETRPLTEFETQALAQLRSQEDLITDQQPNVIRMVGALRAGKDCTACHSVSRGELLGAFTYELHRGNFRPLPPKPKIKPQVLVIPGEKNHALAKLPGN